MGLITESIHKPEVLLFFCLWWDDRNTTAKQPTGSIPSKTHKPSPCPHLYRLALHVYNMCTSCTQMVALFAFVHILEARQTQLQTILPV